MKYKIKGTITVECRHGQEETAEIAKWLETRLERIRKDMDRAGHIRHSQDVAIEKIKEAA